MHYDVAGLSHPPTMLSGFPMSDQVVDRIARALERIERAATAGTEARVRLERRNGTLRTRIESAIADLDAMIADEAATAVPDGDGTELDEERDEEAQG